MTMILTILLIQFFTILYVSSELRTKDTVDALKSWIVSNGGYIHPLLDFHVTKYGGITGFWAEDDFNSHTEKLTPIFLVTEKCMLCTTEETHSPYLAGLLLAEKLKGNDSFFKLYLDTLPTDVDLVWEWSDEEVKQLNSKFMEDKVESYREKIQERYQFFVEKHPSLANQTTKEEFIHFHKLASTRAFRVHGSFEGVCLVPLVDLSNHDYREDATWKTFMNENIDSNMFLFQHKRVEIRKGEEYRFAYTDLSNDRALLSYGFTSSDPEYIPDIKITFNDILPSSPLTTKKMINFMNTKLLVFDPPDGRFVRFFRAAAASEASYELAEKSSYNVTAFFNHPTSRKKEIQTFRTCIKSLKNLINLDETLYWENLNFFESTLSSRERFTLFYRLGNERLFQKYSRFCQRMLQLTTCTTYRGLIKLWVFNRNSSKLPRKIRHLTENLWRNEKELCRSKPHQSALKKN